MVDQDQCGGRVVARRLSSLSQFPLGFCAPSRGRRADGAAAVDEVLADPPDLGDVEVGRDEVPVRQCLAEMCRVLRPGGVMLSTFPFTFYYESEVRARLVDGRIEHLMEPEYHGNPAEPESGSLVFEIPGWNILDTAKDAGFARAELVFVSGMKRAITGAEVGGIFVLRCYRG